MACSTRPYGLECVVYCIHVTGWLDKSLINLPLPIHVHVLISPSYPQEPGPTILVTKYNHLCLCFSILCFRIMLILFKPQNKLKIQNRRFNWRGYYRIPVKGFSEYLLIVFISHFICYIYFNFKKKYFKILQKYFLQQIGTKNVMSWLFTKCIKSFF